LCFAAPRPGQVRADGLLETRLGRPPDVQLVSRGDAFADQAGERHPPIARLDGDQLRSDHGQEHPLLQVPKDIVPEILACGHPASLSDSRD
jgi:hypothetical protein